LKTVSNYSSTVKDHRTVNKCKHKLSDILFIGLLTCLSNGEDFVDMVLFGKTRKTFLQEYVSPANGIPSEDTFERVFSAVEPDVLRVCLSDYGKDAVALLSEKQICLDGKKLKGVSPASRGNRGLFILNAWVAENRICVGQKRVEDKSGEITAIPALIEQIDIKDAVVSIDAIGCQRNIAEQIVKKEGHYLLALKTNQRELYDDAVGEPVEPLSADLKPANRKACRKLGNTTTGVTKLEKAVSFRRKRLYCLRINRNGAD
jgi:hypothetical protein